MINPYCYLYYLVRLSRSYPKRYAGLLQCAFESRCRTILEIGTHNGVHARHLIQTAQIFHPAAAVEYYGCDLFEMLTPELQMKEFALVPPEMSEVEKTLRATKARIHLFKGYSSDTVPQAARELGKVDFVSIDGGHSFDTIESDWSNVRGLMHEKTVVVFDDYYPDEGFRPSGCGCQKLIKELDREVYNVRLLPQVDQFPQEWGTLRICMVRVSLKPR